MFLVLGNLTCAQEPRWLRVACCSGEPSSQNCMTKYGSSYPQIVHWLRVSGVWNYPIGWAYLKCSRSPRNTQSSSFLSSRQIAQNQKLSKNFPTKKHIPIPMTRGRDKRLTWPKRIWRFHGESVRGSLMREKFELSIVFVFFWGKTKRSLPVFIPLQKLNCFLLFWRRSFPVLGYLASSSVFHSSSLRNLTRNSTGVFILGVRNGWVMRILQLGFCSLHFFQSLGWLFYTPESFARYGSMVNRRSGSNRFQYVMPS